MLLLLHSSPPSFKYMYMVQPKCGNKRTKNHYAGGERVETFIDALNIMLYCT